MFFLSRDERIILLFVSQKTCPWFLYYYDFMSCIRNFAFHAKRLFWHCVEAQRYRLMKYSLFHNCVVELLPACFLLSVQASFMTQMDTSGLDPIAEHSEYSTKYTDYFTRVVFAPYYMYYMITSYFIYDWCIICLDWGSYSSSNNICSLIYSIYLS